MTDEKLNRVTLVATVIASAGSYATLRRRDRGCIELVHGLRQAGGADPVREPDVRVLGDIAFDLLRARIHVGQRTLGLIANIKRPDNARSRMSAVPRTLSFLRGAGMAMFSLSLTLPAWRRAARRARDASVGRLVSSSCAELTCG